MQKYTLILIHRGPEYHADFLEIRQKVIDIDPSIAVFIGPVNSTGPIPPGAWDNPTLVVALAQRFLLPVKRGTVLKNHQVSKLGQAKIFREAGIPTPPMLPFKFGMKLDPIMFGEHVIIKPMSLSLTSTGRGVNLFRRKRLEQMGPSDFPKDHLIHRDREGYIVQKFISTGKQPTKYRILTFLGEVLYAMKVQLLESSPDLTEPDDVIERGAFTDKGEKARSLDDSPERVALAKQIAKAFANIPVLGIDIIAEANSNKLYALEINAGGNTWHFSSKMSAERRLRFPELTKPIREQYSAFDTAARVLVKKTLEFAS